MNIQQLKQRAKRCKGVIVASALYYNWRSKRRQRAGNLETASGVLHTRMTLAEQVAYLQRVFAQYLDYGAISNAWLQDKRILEIGPGETLGVALQFVAAGARQVVCVDRFVPKRNLEREAALYRALGVSELLGRLGSMETGGRSQGYTSGGPDGPLVVMRGLPIEAAGSRFAPASFDLIISRSVLEHIAQPDQAFLTMDRLLAPGGRMIHTIDFRDHGLFTRSGFHPLTFLTVPESVYRWMAIDSGQPNRRLLPYYRQQMQAFHYEAQIRITRLLGASTTLTSPKAHLTSGVDYTDSTLDLLRQIRSKLRAPFRKFSDEDLLAAGIILVANNSKSMQEQGQLLCRSCQQFESFRQRDSQ